MQFVQEHWAARRAWEANLEKLVAFEQDAPDLGRSSPLPDRSHTFDDRLHIALSSRDSDCSSIASTLTGASCGSQVCLLQQLQPASLPHGEGRGLGILSKTKKSCMIIWSAR